MAIKAYLVEDQADIRNALVDGMQEVIPLQFIGQGSNEPEALQWLDGNRHTWDVIIIDLVLRDGSGFGVLRACQGRRPQQKAVVLTSYVDDNILAQCQALGADAVFDKNDEIEALVTFCLDHAEDLGKAKNALTPPAVPALPNPGPLGRRRAPQALPDASTLVPWRRPRKL
jgi:DNA-binding NarL/FixJ family response regulator